MKSTHVSYPERGAGGSNQWRGNCSPRLIADLIEQYQLRSIADFMCGSGTTGDAAKQKGIPCSMYDLHSGYDMLTMEIPERAENIFWHPPYWTIVQYAGNMYDAASVDSKYGIEAMQADLSKNQPWDAFVKEMNYCMMQQYRALEKGGRMFTLVGDIKKKGRLYSMIFELCKPGTLEQVIIKAQHNCWSDDKQYAHRNYVPIAHEYLLVLKKDASLCYPVLVTAQKRQDIRNVANATWRDVVASILEEAGPSELEDIYAAVKECKRTEQNPTFYKEKVRQTLYRYRDTFLQENGKWKKQGSAA